MAKKLKVWNGRFSMRPKHGKDADLFATYKEVHGNVCAYSRADAARVIEEYLGYMPNGMGGELKNYWSDCWGNSMKDVEHERGLWIEFDHLRNTSFVKRVV